MTQNRLIPPIHKRYRARCLLALATLSIAWPAADAQNGLPEVDVAQISDPPASTSPDARGELGVRAAMALDHAIDLHVEDQPLVQVLEKLAQQVDLSIALTPEAARFLPYGWQTRVSAAIQQRTLREALTALLTPLGFTFTPSAEGLLLEPVAPLRRLARRPTWEDLDTLGPLYHQEYSDALFDGLKFQFRDIPAENGEANRRTLLQRASAVGAGTAAEVLEQACEEQGWTWYPDGTQIVVLPKARQIERQLDKRVSLRYTNIHLAAALTDLANQAGVLIHFDPGVLAGLPPQTTERFSLSIENATVRQALEVVAGETGLSYVIEPDGLRITQPNYDVPSASLPSTATVDVQAAVAAIRSNAIVGQLTFPMPDGSSFSFFIRQDDLPHDVDVLRKNKITDAINRIRREIHSELQQD